MRLCNRIAVFLLLCSSAWSADWYASTAGTAGGDGSIGSPWDLATALNKTATVQPGDTLWVRGGTYGAGGGAQIANNLHGTLANKIIIRPYAGEHVIVDGGIGGTSSTAQYTTIRDFEILNSSVTRNTNTAGRAPCFFYPNGSSYGNSAINNILHDCGNTAAQWNDQGDGSEYLGNIEWGNGIYDATVGSMDPLNPVHRGDGLYCQNSTGTVLVEGNISFWNFTEQLKCYSEGNNVKGVTFRYNTLFEGGNRLLFVAKNGGSSVVERATITSNWGWSPNESGVGPSPLNNKKCLQVGYAGENADATVTNNYFVCGDSGTTAASYANRFSSLVWTGNTFVGNGTGSGSIMEIRKPSSVTVQTVNNNSYFGGSSTPFHLLNNDNSADTNCGPIGYCAFAAWKTSSGVDASSTYTSGQPTTNQVFLYGNPYETNRVNVTIYNWQQLATVSVDLTGHVATGTTVEIRDVQNYFGTPLVSSFVYSGGSVNITMPGAGSPVSSLVGSGSNIANDCEGVSGCVAGGGTWPSGNPVHTSTKFGAFVVLPLSSGGGGASTYSSKSSQTSTVHGGVVIR